MRRCPYFVVKLAKGLPTRTRAVGCVANPASRCRRQRRELPLTQIVIEIKAQLNPKFNSAGEGLAASCRYGARRRFQRNGDRGPGKADARAEVEARVMSKPAELPRRWTAMVVIYNLGLIW